MSKTVKFFNEVDKLKGLERTGWILMGIKNPETVAEHTFRLAVLAWFFAAKQNLDIKKAIKIAIIHDLCEVYAKDITTLLYHPELQKEKDAKKRKKIEMKWARLSLKEKQRIGRIQFNKEKKSLLKLVSLLDVTQKKEIFSLWMEYEEASSPEGRLVLELNSIETLIQSIEYFGTNIRNSGTTWWESTEEIVETPLLKEFLKVIQDKFYNSPSKKSKIKKDLENILDFILEIGKIKEAPRKGWTLTEVKNPETIGGHIFLLSLMVIVFSKDKSLKLNEEKLIKMVLCHGICKVSARNRTPYDEILKKNNTKKGVSGIKNWIRLSRKEKFENFIKKYQEEQKSLKMVTKSLNATLSQEMSQIWEESKAVNSPEARFFNQIDVLANLFQGLQYWNKDKNFPIVPFWEWLFEAVDNILILEFTEDLKRVFYKKKLVFPSLFSIVLKKRFGGKK